MPPRKRGLPRAAMDGRAWRRSVKRCSTSRGATRLANAAARPGAAREVQGGRACSVRAHDAPRRGVERLWRLLRLTGRRFFESSSREALAPCPAKHPIMRSAVPERGSVRAERAAAEAPPFPPSLSGILRFSFSLLSEDCFSAPAAARGGFPALAGGPRAASGERTACQCRRPMFRALARPAEKPRRSAEGA